MLRSDVSALILAGGRATRLGGVAKHELVISGSTIFARQCRVLSPRVAEILVSSPNPIPGHRTVRDTVEGVGPLAGIAAGLAAARTPWLLILAGDMPFITGELVDALLSLSTSTAALDAVCVRERGHLSPLVSLVHTGLRPHIDARLAAGRHAVHSLFADSSLHVAWLDDPDAHALRSINSPEDLATAQDQFTNPIRSNT